MRALLSPREALRKSTLSLLLSCLSLGALTLLSACDDEPKGATCSLDDDCERGALCESGRCTEVSCASISECPGTGRTCLSDLQRCGVKECGDTVNGEARTCSEGLTCLNEGPYRFSCVSEGALGCDGPEECVGSPDGSACCDGVCKESCEPPLSGMTAGTTGGTTGGSAGVMAGVEAGVMMSEPASLCTPCRSNATCSELGEGATCTAIGDGSFCTRSCDPANPCPNGYNCAEMLGQCVPNGYRCVDCLQTPCADGGFCDVTSGECVPPRGLCSPCTEDAACADGGLCRQVGAESLCLKSCEASCPADTACVEGACVPNEGTTCDACASACGGDTPFCVEDEGRCAACGPTAPCGEGFNCDLATYTCVDATNGSCLSDADCGDGVCVIGECKECLQDSDCPSRHRCDPSSFSCVYEPCAGVECQRGSMCNPSTGRCTPGCMTAQDCALPESMGCNTETGQCYYTNGGCDFGGDGVCAPGGQCVPNALAFLDPTLPPSCTCAKDNPSDPLSPDRIGCQPGTTCNDLGSLLSGFGIDPSTLEFEATCGTSLFGP